MGVPKRKTSRSRRGNRRSHDRVAAAKPVLCPNCGEAHLSHHVCPECGYYDGEEIIKPKEE
jgi:large subunit ribosomal protein L32